MEILSRGFWIVARLQVEELLCSQKDTLLIFHLGVKNCTFL